MSQHQQQQPETAEKKKTGPNTPEGKARSSVNARKHGFSGFTLIVAEDEQEEFDDFLAQWESDLDPEGPLECSLFGQIIHSAWNLRRLSRAEADLIDESLADPLTCLDAQNQLRLYSIYRSRTERTFHKSIAELRKVQEERVVRGLILRKDHEPVLLLPRAAYVRREADRDKRIQSRAGRDAIHAMMNAPMPSPPPNYPTQPPSGMPGKKSA